MRKSIRNARVGERAGRSDPKPLEYKKDDGGIVFFVFLWIRDLFTCHSLPQPPKSLHRIASVLRICYSLVDLCLLCFTVFEEIDSHLREQCIRQYIFVLLAPLFTFFT